MPGSHLASRSFASWPKSFFFTSSFSTMASITRSRSAMAAQSLGCADARQRGVHLRLRKPADAQPALQHFADIHEAFFEGPGAGSRTMTGKPRRA